MYKRLLTALMLTASLAVGQVMDFDGADQYVRCANDSIPTDDPSLTLSAWVNIDAWDDSLFSTIASKWDATAGEGFLFGITGTTRTPVGRICILNQSLTISEDSTGAIRVAGGWYHVAAVLDAAANSIAWYIDGEHDSTDTGVPAMLEAANDLHIAIDGRDRIGYEWDGQLDDIRIYSTALTSNEVARLTLDTCEMYDPLTAYDTDTVADYAGSNDGTPQNDPTLVFGARDLAGNEAMEFDGSDDYITITDSQQVDVNSETTFSYWFNPRSFSTLDVHFSKDQGTADSQYLFRTGTDAKLDVYVHSTNEGGGKEEVGDFVFSSNNWYYITIVFSEPNNNILVYKNGELLDTITITSTARSSGTGALNIGRDNRNITYLDGSIDDTRIYPSALTSNQVSDLYTYELTGGTSGSAPTNNMAAYYTFTPPPSDLHDYASEFDTSYGNTNLAVAWRGDHTGAGNGNSFTNVPDIAGNGNDGTAYNDPTIEAAR